MNEKILKLEESISKDEKKISLLQSSISTKKAKLKEISNADILRDVHILEASGVQVRELINAINRNNNETILKYASKKEKVKDE